MRACRTKRSYPTDGPLGQPATTVDPVPARPMHDAFRYSPANSPRLQSGWLKAGTTSNLPSARNWRPIVPPAIDPVEGSIRADTWVRRISPYAMPHPGEPIHDQAL